jgi:hypothetical protein
MMIDDRKAGGRIAATLMLIMILGARRPVIARWGYAIPADRPKRRRLWNITIKQWMPHKKRYHAFVKNRMNRGGNAFASFANANAPRPKSAMIPQTGPLAAVVRMKAGLHPRVEKQEVIPDFRTKSQFSDSNLIL